MFLSLIRMDWSSLPWSLDGARLLGLGEGVPITYEIPSFNASSQPGAARVQRRPPRGEIDRSCTVSLPKEVSHHAG